MRRNGRTARLRRGTAPRRRAAPVALGAEPVGRRRLRILATQQQRSAQDLLISNQVSTGFELLGNKEKKEAAILQRLGCIYALEGVMKTSEQYHWPVLEALCAFVRDSTKDKTGIEPPATDVLAALTVIGRRDKKIEGEHSIEVPNLTGAHLSQAPLPLINLGPADLAHVDLSHAILSHADLTHAVLPRADLSHAELSDAFLRNANLTEADLTDAKGLSQEQLDQACGVGKDIVDLDKLDPPLTFHGKLCPTKQQ